MEIEMRKRLEELANQITNSAEEEYRNKISVACGAMILAFEFELSKLNN